MVTNYSDLNWKIEHSCPQCGAPIVLEETDRIFSCPYCRVRLFIWPGDHSRFYLTPKSSTPGSPVFVPYWSLKGMVYSLEGIEIKSKIINTSLLAVKSFPLPPSLGVRPQVLKLRYATSSAPGSFLKPAFPFRELSAEGPVSPFAPEPEEIQTVAEYFIGEAVSLIFTPVTVRGNTLLDAILQRPLGAVPDALRDHIATAGTINHAEKPQPFFKPGSLGTISFFATLCPRCGWDQEGERDSLILFCRNCNSAWQAGDGGLREVAFSFWPCKEEPSVWLPFWRLRAGVSGLDLDSRDDLLRLANLRRKTAAEGSESKPHFWVPAFKLQPNLFLRLARTLTVAQKDFAGPAKPTKAPLFPATLPINEALESVRVLIASLAVPKKLIFPLIPRIELSLLDRMLVFVPFETRGEELIQPELMTSVQKNALKWGRLI